MIIADSLTKRYYKIGELAKMFQVSTSLLRYWESEFPSLKPLKTKTRIRKYQKDDILMLDRIYELVKVQGFTLEGARNELKKKSKSSVNPENIESNNLIKLRRELNVIRQSLLDLKDKITES